MGNSIRFLPPTLRDTARFAPSGDQSASFTFSRISRGAPPDSGTRASVPAVPFVVAPSRIAISPVELMERMRPSGRSSARYSRLPGRIEKMLVGSLAHCALNTTVWPSSENFADGISPRRYVRDSKTAPWFCKSSAFRPAQLARFQFLQRVFQRDFDVGHALPAALRILAKAA